MLVNKAIAKKVCVFIISVFLAVAGFAQQRLVNGFLLDSTTLLPISNGVITNTSTKTTVKTDKNGFFKLSASPNDLIYATAKSCRFDTIRYSYLFTDTITIYLSFAGNVLPAVTVRGQYNRYQLDSIDRKKDFEQSRGTVLKTLASNDHPSGFGITINLDRLFRKRYRNQKKDERVFNALEKVEYVNYRFSPNLVAYYTGYRGDELRRFMSFYTPSYQWLRQHPANEDVMYYINDRLKVFKSLQKK